MAYLHPRGTHVHDLKPMIIKVSLATASLTKHTKRKIIKQHSKSNKNNLGGVHGFSAPGGTGKTFLVATILSKMWLRGEIAIATAARGIATTEQFPFWDPAYVQHKQGNCFSTHVYRPQSHRRNYSSPSHRSGSTPLHHSRYPAMLS